MLTQKEYLEIEEKLDHIYDIHNMVRSADFKQGIITVLNFIYKFYMEKSC